MMRILILAILLGFGATMPLHAEGEAPKTAEAPSLDWLHGSWPGGGQMFGMPSKASLKIDTIFSGKMTRLHYAIEAGSENGARRKFKGRGIYKVALDGKITGQWADSGGALRDISGTVKSSTMTVIWGDAATQLGRSTYDLQGDDSLKVSDSVLARDGSWRVFATAYYRRK